MKQILFFIFIFSTYNILLSQKQEPNWTRVPFEYSSRMYVDLNSVKTFENNDVNVWTMEENFPPLVIESVKGKIYKTKTLYLFNSELKKYSFIEIIYYDENDNVLKSFSYRRDTKVDSYQYNYPIMDNSIQNKILEKCLLHSKGNN